jgi:hypothetical protein
MPLVCRYRELEVRLPLPVCEVEVRGTPPLLWVSSTNPGERHELGLTEQLLTCAQDGT